MTQRDLLKFKHGLVVLLVIGFASIIAVAKAEEPQLSSEEEAEWVEIRKIKGVYEEAIAKNDLSQLKPYLAENFSGAMVTGEEVKSYDEMQSYNQRIWKMIGQGGSYKVKVEYAPGYMKGDAAMAHGTTLDQVKTSEGTEYKFGSIWTATLLKEAGKWKLFRLHASMDPINNTFVKSFSKAAAYKYGVFGLVIGLLGGMLLLRFKRSAA